MPPSTTHGLSQDLFRPITHDIEHKNKSTHIDRVSEVDEEDEDDNDSSFLAISKSVRKSKVSNRSVSKESSPKSTRMSFHSAQESPSAEDRRTASPLPTSSPILAPEREILHVEDQPSPEPENMADDYRDTPTSVKVPLKDESESTFGFARLPAREPFTKKSFGKMPSRERSWLDIKPPAVLATQHAEADNLKDLSLVKSHEDIQISYPQLSKPTDSDPRSPKSLRDVQPKQLTPKRVVSTSMLIDSEVPQNTRATDVEMAHVEPDLVTTLTVESAELSVSPSKGSLFRSRSKKEGPGTPNGGIFSATFGALRKAKKLLFEGHDDKDKRSPEPKSPSKHKIFPMSNSSIPRSPLRSPSRNKSPVSTVARKEKPPASPSKKLDTFSRLMAPTFSSSARQEQELPASSPKKILYPEIPKLFHEKPKFSRGARSPSPDRNFTNSADIGRLRDASTMATMGSDSPSPVRQGRPPSPQKADPIASKTRSATSNQVSDSTGPKYGVPTPSRVGASKLTKHPLIKRTNTTTTPGPKQAPAPMPIRVPMTSHREVERKAPSSAKSVLSKQPLTSMSLTKTRLLGHEDDKRKETAIEGFSSKFKAALSSKSGKDSDAAGGGGGKEKAKSYKTFGRDSVTGKRTSESAFGSPAERSHMASSSLREPPVKKPSFGPSSSLMKNAIMHQAKNTAAAAAAASSKGPYMDSVKFSNDKIKFGPSSATTALSNVSSSSFQRTPSIISTTSSKSSYASVNSHFGGYQNSHLQPPPNNASNNAFNNNNNNNNAFNNPVTPGPSSSSTTSTTILPDIFSESEDDDDGSVILDWANSPELRTMLLRQQQVDPDLVFGPIAPLQMDEVFRTTSRGGGGGGSRFRPRSSSANWSGQDKLSQVEIEKYAKEMGYYDNK